MNAVVPLNWTKTIFWQKRLLFYVFKPTERSDLNEVLYKIQQIKFFEENTENKLRKMVRKRVEV